MKKLICYVTGGLSNRVLHIASCLVYSQFTNRECYLYWPVDDMCGVTFNDLYSNNISTIGESFLNSLPENQTEYYSVALDGVVNDFNIYKRTYLYDKYQRGLLKVNQYPQPENDSENIVFLNNIFMDTIAKEDNIKVLKSLKFNDNILEIANRFIIDKEINKDVIGVHARGTDFNTTFEYWERLINRSGCGDKRLFICSDDKELEDRLKNHYTNAIVREDKVYRYDEGKRVGLNPMIDAAIDLYILSKTNIQIYSNNSTFSMCAKYLGE
jgi:hypothetical protein